MDTFNPLVILEWLNTLVILLATFNPLVILDWLNRIVLLYTFNPLVILDWLNTLVTAGYQEVRRVSSVFSHSLEIF